MKNQKRFAFATRVIHGGQQHDPSTGAVMVPIYTTSTYAQTSPGKHTGFEYSRAQNPTRYAFERALADLENGQAGFAFASGMAATATILELLNSGDHVIVMNDLYGGTFRLFDKVRKHSANLQYSLVDLTNTNNLTAAKQANTRMIWLETPTNPTLKIVDLNAIVKFAKQHNIITVVDNTFATPWVQRPLDFGCDIVMHSATKYINGHSDMIGGIAVVGNKKELGERMQFLQMSTGGIAGPFDSYLALRGVKTLALRMQRHCESALKIAQWLEQHSQVERVYYPGLSSHPQHAIAKQQMHGFGGMLSFDIVGGALAATKFLEHCHLFTLAESLGGVESLIEYPAVMSHASIPAELRMKAGITDALIRVSVGIEDADDLIADLEQAFSKSS